MTNDFIAKNFGVTPVQRTKTDIVNQELSDDFITARRNILLALETQTGVIQALNELADQSQSFHYYDSLNSHIKTFIEANKALLNIRKEANDMDQNRPKSQTINNNLVITTAELSRILKKIEDDGNDKNS